MVLKVLDEGLFLMKGRQPKTKNGVVQRGLHETQTQLGYRLRFTVVRIGSSLITLLLA